MKTLELKYGCNPNQAPASVTACVDTDLPFTVLNGRAGYINLLDALNSWQLVRELKLATGLPAAASFKHVSPAGAAIAEPLTDILKKIYFVENLELTPMATAYIRARGTDRMSSYGDFVALSDECDEATATFLASEVSDGVIAPSYSPRALEILKGKRNGTYVVIQMDPTYEPPEIEYKYVFGIRFSQKRNNVQITTELLNNIPTDNQTIPEDAKRDLLIALITLKYTQSNSVCYAKGGQAIGIGAGQQSRVHCTRLAGDKADIWHLRQAAEVLNLPFKEDIRRANRDNAIDQYITQDYRNLIKDQDWCSNFTTIPAEFTKEQKRAYLDKIHGVSLGSDAFFPFGDNVERAHLSGVDYIAQAGGSIRDDHVIATCNKYNIAMAMIGIRLFHH